MEKMVTYKIADEITQLARQAGKDDPDYYLHEKAGISRSMNVTKKVSLALALEVLEELEYELS